MTRLLPGAFCTSLFSDYGAEVIKVESVDEGDYARNMGLKAKNGQSIGFSQLNRNKKSLSVNLKTTQGLELFKEFINIY